MKLYLLDEDVLITAMRVYYGSGQTKRFLTYARSWAFDASTFLD